MCRRRYYYCCCCWWWVLLSGVAVAVATIVVVFLQAVLLLLSTAPSCLESALQNVPRTYVRMEGRHLQPRGSHPERYDGENVTNGLQARGSVHVHVNVAYNLYVYINT